MSAHNHTLTVREGGYFSHVCVRGRSLVTSVVWAAVEWGRIIACMLTEYVKLRTVAIDKLHEATEELTLLGRVVLHTSHVEHVQCTQALLELVLPLHKESVGHPCGRPTQHDSAKMST